MALEQQQHEQLHLYCRGQLTEDAKQALEGFILDDDDSFQQLHEVSRFHRTIGTLAAVNAEDPLFRAIFCQGEEHKAPTVNDRGVMR